MNLKRNQITTINLYLIILKVQLNALKKYFENLNNSIDFYINLVGRKTRI